MALIKKSKFRELAQIEKKYCISIYIPTNRTGDNQDSIIRLKNQVKNVEKELSDLGVKPAEIGNYLDPVKDLINNHGFWRYLSDALVILSNADSFYHTTLPLDVKDFSMISDHYYLLPLLTMFDERRFLILALSQNKNRLFEATQYEISQIVTEEHLPENILESVGRDVEQKSLQYRSGQAGNDIGLFHGKGEGKDDKQTEITKYLQDVDRGLQKILEGNELPLVVASTENLFSKFREVSRYDNVFPQHIQGNFDEADALIIHEKALEELTPYLDKNIDKDRNTFIERKNKTATKADEVLEAAMAGNIESLFVRKHQHIWGDYNKQNGSVSMHKEKQPMSRDLLNDAACLAFLKGGRVFLQEQENMPDPEHRVNAILRF